MQIGHEQRVPFTMRPGKDGTTAEPRLLPLTDPDSIVRKHLSSRLATTDHEAAWEVEGAHDVLEQDSGYRRRTLRVLQRDRHVGQRFELVLPTAQLAFVDRRERRRTDGDHPEHDDEHDKPVELGARQPRDVGGDAAEGATLLRVVHAEDDE